MEEKVTPLRRWLSNQPEQYRQALAFRLVLRDFPMQVALADDETGNFCLHSLRSLISTAVSAWYDDPELDEVSLKAFRILKENDREAFLKTVPDLRSDADFPPILDADYSFEDAENLKSRGIRSVLSSPLWSSKAPIPDHVQELGKDLIARFSRVPSTWGFWERWYEGMLRGDPMDWALQRAVALIPDEDWQQGAAHIAGRIAEIEARFDLKARIAELEQELVEASRSRFGIGGNNPPDAIEDAPHVAKAFEIIWTPLQDLKAETEAERPDKARVLRAVEGLKIALASCGLWAWDKIDRTANAGAIAFGTAAGGAGGAAFVAWVTGHGEAVVAVVDAALKWLPFL